MTKLKKAESVLLFLTLLFLPTQLGKHFWPNFSYVYSLKVDYLSPTIYFWDILVFGLLIVWFLQKPKINKLALNLLLLFLLTQILSLFQSSNMEAGLVRLEQYFLSGFLGVYLASTDSKKLVSKIFLPLILAVILESVIATLQFTRGETLGLWILGERTFSISTPAIAKFDFYGNQFLRPYATFSHPNVLAGFILVVLATFFDSFYSLRVRMTIFKASFLLGSITIFLTQSRAVILAGIVILVIFARKWLFWVILVSLLVSPILFTRFSSILNFDNLALLRREELIQSSFKIFLRHPMFGVGTNNFIPAIAGDLTAGPSRFLQPVHNIYLLILAESGIIGLLGFVMLIGYPIKRISNLLPFFIILFLGLFDHYFLTLPQGYRLLFLVWGLCLSKAR